MFKKAAVAYNNVFRKLLGMKRGESISAIYATLNIDAFQVLNRKSLYSFINRMSLSDNIIINCITYLSYFVMFRYVLLWYLYMLYCCVVYCL